MEEGLHIVTYDDDPVSERTVCLSEAEILRRYEAAVQRYRSTPLDLGAEAITDP